MYGECLHEYSNITDLPSCSMLVVLRPHSHGHSHSHRRSHSNSKEMSLSDLSKENASKIDKERRKSSGRLKWRPLKKHGLVDNINVQAAFIHVIGDLIQSIGVVIAGYIIWFKVGLLSYTINFIGRKLVHVTLHNTGGMWL